MPRRVRTDVGGPDTASSPVAVDWCWGEGRLQDETFLIQRTLGVVVGSPHHKQVQVDRV